MTRTRIAWAVGFLALAVMALAVPRPALAGEVVFRAQLKELGMQLPHLDRGTKFGDTVEVVLPGELFEPPRELGAISRDQVERSTPEGAIRSDFSAWKADDAAWILANFAAGDRAALTAFLADATMRAGSKAGFAKFDSIFIWGVVRRQAYALVLVTYGQGADRSRGLTAALVQEDGGWRRSNALTSDETLDLVWAAFRVGEMTARP